jgi:hypothetical protein
MKRRKAVKFYNPATSESYLGDCPRWIEGMKRFRRDLESRTVVVYGDGTLWRCYEGC